MDWKWFIIGLLFGYFLLPMVAKMVMPQKSAA